MVTLPKRTVRLIAVGVVVALAAYVWLSSGGGRGVLAPPDPTRGGKPVAGLTRIDLARLKAQREESSAGRKNIFEEAAEPAPRVASHGAPPPTPPQTLVPLTPPPELPPTPPPVPPLNVKYVGSVERKGDGVRVAVLLTDRQEVLTGQAGEVVANRLRIVKIGFESVDVQDVGSDRVRRIPLKGN